MGVLNDVGAGPVALDTCVFIYLIEDHPTYLPILQPLFEAIDGGRIAAVTSMLTLLETVVVPLRRGATAFVTNDRRLQSRPGLLTLQLDDYR